MNSLRKIFFPTEEELKEQERRFEEIHNDLLEDRKTVKLVQTDRSFLFCREPFKSFLGDCCFCSHYIDGGGMTEGAFSQGECLTEPDLRDCCNQSPKTQGHLLCFFLFLLPIR